MSTTGSAIMEWGKFLASVPDGLDGYEQKMRYKPSPDVTSMLNVPVQSDVLCLVVKNDTGAALLPRELVAWKTGGRRTAIGSKASTANGMAAGVVDPFLPASGVPNGSYFLLVVKGLVRCRKTTAAGFTENGFLAASATAGQCQQLVVSGTWANTIAAEILNNIGRAAEARIAADTDALIDVNLY